MARLPTDPEGFIRANTALERPVMVPEFRLWLATEYVPIWQATEAWLDEQNVDPPYWAFCWPGGQAVARYLLDHPEAVRRKRVLDFAAGSGVSSMAAAQAGALSVIANDIDLLSLVAARLAARPRQCRSAGPARRSRPQLLFGTGLARTGPLRHPDLAATREPWHAR